MPTRVEKTGPTTVDISGEVELEGLTATEVHEIAVALTTYRCPHCNDDHRFVVIADRDPATGEGGSISVQSPQEAWALATYLIVETFGVVDAGDWMAMKAAVEIGQQTRQAVQERMN